MKSISENVKKQVEGLFVTDGKLKYPVIPSNKNKELNLKCDSCNPDDGDCSNVCPENYDSYSGFGINAIPTYRNDRGENVPVFKVGDSYTDCGQGGCGKPWSSTPQYYYKAPTVTVDDFKIPEATSEDQTVKVPVTVSYVDGSKCTFDASFVVKPNPTPEPQPQPKPQPPTPPAPQPEPQPAPQPTPTPTPTPEPGPDQPETPSGQSHMTEPETLPKPYLNIDVTPDSNIGTTPNTGSANSNMLNPPFDAGVSNPYSNQKQDVARNGAAPVVANKGNKTGACANFESHKSRGTVPATGAELSSLALAATLSVLFGFIAICKRKFKQYIL